MADIEELRQMVCTFRVSELQVLLGFAGRNKSGRKQELMSRALQLIHRGCAVPIQIKIKELHRRRFPSRQPQQTTSGSCLPDMKTPPRPTNNPVIPSSGIHGTELGSSLGTILDAPVDFSKNRLQLPVHPDVRFKSLPFYDVLGELVKPTSLVPRGASRFQESFCMFHLTPQQAQDIAMSREIHPGARVDYTVQIQLRFCLLETSCDQADNFPSSICVRVNGKIATLPPPIPTNKPGVEPKRPGRPVNITNLCRISPTTPNHVAVSWAAEFAKGFCLTINLVRKLNSDILLQRLKSKGIRHPDHSRAMIKEKLSPDPDSEIAMTSLRVSLQCPLGKMRQQIPARAISCSHVQCFDVTTYLMMNERKPTWICPVCDKPCPYEQLHIDGLFTEILTDCDSEEIQFFEDGSWSSYDPAKKAETMEAAKMGSKPLDESVTIVEEEDEEQSKVEQEVIDLTLSSSEDEGGDDDETDKNDSSMDRTLSPVSQHNPPCASVSPVSPVSPAIPPAKTEPASKEYKTPMLSRLIESNVEEPAGWPAARSLASSLPPLPQLMASQAYMSRYRAPPQPDLDMFNMDFESNTDDIFRTFLDPSVSVSHSLVTNRSTSFAPLPSFTYHSTTPSLPPYNLWHPPDDSPGSDVIPID